MMKVKPYSEKECRTKIIDAIKAAFAAPPHEVIMGEDLLGEEWEEFCDDIYYRGVLVGLKIAKKSWGEGDTIGDLMENERYYYELLSSDVAED